MAGFAVADSAVPDGALDRITGLASVPLNCIGNNVRKADDRFLGRFFDAAGTPDGEDAPISRGRVDARRHTSCGYRIGRRDEANDLKIIATR